MTLGQFLVMLLIAAIIGSLAQALVGYSHGGCLVSAALGFIGAVLGTWLAGLLGAPELWTIDVGEARIPVVWSIIGATLFVGVLQIFVRRDGGDLN